MRVVLSSFVCFGVVLAGCPTSSNPDAGTDSGSDGGGLDGGRPDDVPAPMDGGVDAGVDGGTTPDTTPDLDGGGLDTAMVDVGTPDAPPDTGAEPCPTPGALETIRCGTMCGTQERFCTSGRTWEYGACMEAGACVPGTTGPAPCGNCGTAVSRCDAFCNWVPTGACIGEGECAPGTVVMGSRTEVGCPPGQTRAVVCNDACMNVAGTCEVETCMPGEVDTVACGMCGTRDRFCTVAGRWDFSAMCVGGGTCMAGTMRSVTCGACGTQAESCDATCNWVPRGMCSGELPCPPRPSDTCVDASTLRRFSPIPSCVMGACGYVSTDISCACAAGACTTPPGLLRGLGGPVGFGTNNLAPNDDGSSPAIDLTTVFGAGLRFYDTTHTTAFVNNNGNVSFGAPLPTYTPMFLGATQPLIAPFWGDVDTRADGRPARNNVYWFQDATRLIITWHLVGYYAMNNTRQNSFQIVLTDRRDVSPGDFDVELRYESCQWTTGDASGGMGGLGGMPAGAGFNAGDGTRALTLPGSGTAAILDLCTTTNSGVPGVWAYRVRGGVPM